MPSLVDVLLLGDSIRLGYEPGVAQRLGGRALVSGPGENCGDSAKLARRLAGWVSGAPAVVHFNCGLHDVRLAERHQVELAQYEVNLREIVARLRKSGAALVFATTTPVIDERHARRSLGFDRFEADVLRYNDVAVRVMEDAAVTVNDLHALVLAAGPERLLGPDGTHFLPEGNELLAEAVAGAIERMLP